MKNYGYIPSKIDATHWQFGASNAPKDLLQLDRNWQPYLPKYEPQAVNFDTFGCGVFGTLNVLEILMKKIFGYDYNYAERYQYNLVGINPPIGSDPHIVAETIRKNGLLLEEILPMTTTLEEYKTPRPMVEPYLSQGQKWLTEHSFYHEWVFTNSPAKEARIALIREALQYSPLALSVTAWYPQVDGMYPDNGQPNSHWVTCFAMDGDSPLIFDSYAQDGNPIKKLSPDHHIEMCKRYYIGIGQTPVEKDGWIQGMFKAILQALGIVQKEINELPKPITPPTIVIKTKSDELYDLSFSLIGKHLTMDNTVPKEFGCAQAVSYLFKEMGYKTMLACGISSTTELEKWLEQYCTEIQTPEKGCIIISVSYTGVKGARGHVGVVGKDAIMSNDSDTGLWEPYWSLAGWLPHYRDELKLRTRYFKL